jgi:hypothetical protein
MNSTETPCLTVPLGREAHAIARQFAAEQTTPQKGKQTYLNTLAVYTVHSYLKWLQVDTNLDQGDSWHPGKRALFDVADLVLPGIGKLECRPVLPGEAAISLPPEVTQDRIGYVAVQFSESLNEVKLLGFVRAVAISPVSEQILIAELQPLDALLDCIPDPIPQPAVAQPVPSASQVRVNLSRWLDNIFEFGWQTVEALLNAEAAKLALNLRSAEQLREISTRDSAINIRGGKLINLGMQLANQQVVLTVKLTPRSESEVDIRLRVYPAFGQIDLPANLQLMVCDKSGICLETQARSIDNWIQLEFSGEKGEQFSVKVALGDVSVTEDFVI